MLHST